MVVASYIRQMKYLAFLWLISLASAGLYAQPSGPVVTGMQTEHLTNPLGIDAAHPRLSWRLNGSERGAGQMAYALVAGTDSAAVLAGRGTIWQTGKRSGPAQLVTYDGPPLQPFTRYYWRVTVWGREGQAGQGPVASFETGMLDQSHWKGSWITDTKDIRTKPAAYFRHSFSLAKRIASARVYIAVAGLYELSINGRRIGDRVLDPMYTRFDRRNLYTTYDVTAALQQGDNTIGILLGNGWYNLQSTAVWYFDKAPWRSRPSVCLDLRLTYTDGSVETISTGKNWKTASSPVVFNSIYTGEHVDDRLSIPHWDEPSFADSAWKPVIFTGVPSQHVTAETTVPIRITDTLAAVRLRRFSDTDYVFDLGRNIAGVSRISVQGPAGTILRLKHGERLYPTGHVDQSNIDVHYRPTDDSDPFQTDIYTLKGEGEETFQPRFNYKGFQYVEVTASQPVALQQNSLRGYFMHSDVSPVGHIECSNPTINQIWQATNASYLSNLFGYPTDCPQREKNGWTGDAQIAVETGLYNFDAITVYEKWLADLRDEQQPNGVLPSIVPTGGWGYEWGNGPDWTSAIAIIPWNIYLFYGDPQPLRDCYDNIKRYVDHINSLYPSGLTTWGLGDWIPVKSKTPVEFTSSAYYYADVVVLARAARLFHHDKDYALYSKLAEKIKAAFNSRYLDAATGNYDKGLQTELSAALYWHLVPTPVIPKTAAVLAARVRADSVKLDVGLLGTKTILNALSENGYADLAYQLASSETEPSWGWWMKNGATTLYENWPINAGSDISLNHIMFGEISAWFYKGLGGILPDSAEPGFRHIRLQPHFVPGLDEFSATHDCPFGTIVSHWQWDGGRLTYTATIPAGASATLILEVPGRGRQVEEIGSGTWQYILMAGEGKFRRG
jgi:alpha-L-rhamnosidase